MAQRRMTGTAPQRGKSATRKKVTTPPSKAVAADGQDSAFTDALLVDFRRHGAAAITRLREDDPASYIKMCASVLPKAVIDSVDPIDSLSDDELLKRARRLAEKAGLGPRPDPDRAGKTTKSE